MKTLTVVTLIFILSGAVMGANVPGALDAPVLESASVVDANIVLEWSDVNDAAKYSVDIEGIVTYTDSNSLVDVNVPVTVSFGTSDRADGGLMGDSNLTIAVADITAAVLDALAAAGVNLDYVADFEFLAAAKVKALDPGKDKGRQNNPFSNSVDLPAIIWP